jgi:hypothetical protein
MKYYGWIDTAGEAIAEGTDSPRGEEGEQTMTDTMTQKPLRVSTDGTAGPYIMLPVNQLDEVRRLLDSRHVGYWVEENAISLNGAPETAVINLGRGGNAATVQDLLDSVP